jgi:cell division protein FtsI/penicillin-binding protein 2
VLEEKLFSPDSKLSLPSTMRVAGHTIHDAETRGAVTWSLRDIVTHSSNIGAVKLGMKLGKHGLYDAFECFGLTETTGVDFPGEAKGWLPPTDQWSGTSIASIPFGQGVSATPLQLARAVSAIANKGVLVTPHFLLGETGDASAGKSWPTRRACSEKTAVTTTGMLKNVVVEGTGKAAAVPGYVVAGKTGTAQVPENGKYAKGKYISSFIGYLPADDAQLLIEVKLDEPTKASYGGTVAAPSFSLLAQVCCDHLKIPATDAQNVIVGDKPGVSEESSRSADKSKRATKKSGTAKRISTDEVTDDSSSEKKKR